jgi:transposase-like protein
MGKTTPSVKKRTQRDYTLAFKLSVVDQVEKGEMTYRQAQSHYGIQGRSTVLVWLRKHGTLNWNTPSEQLMTRETPEQKIKRLERELQDKDDYAYLLEETIKKVDQIKGTDFRKKFLDSLPEHLRSKGE